MSSKPSLTLKRRLTATPEKVFSAWTDPEKIARWWGPAQIKTVHAEADARVGGRFNVIMRSPDGEEHNVSGVYREVIPNEKLVFTWAWRSTPERESLVTVALKADGAGTALTLTHEQFFDEAARDSHKSGWSGSLDKLERFCDLQAQEAHSA
ncbi:MAG: SRPBCC family protein [Hyphomicrobium sp.]